jgi:predicted chitinase
VFKFEFEFEFTKNKLTNSLSLYEGDVDLLFDAINKVVPKYRVSSEQRLAGFIDQFEYKTNGFKDLTKLSPVNDIMLRRFAAFIKMPMDDVHAYCNTLEGALDSAGWLWNTNYLNIVADNYDLKNLSKRINPDLEDITNRIKNYDRINIILKGKK